MAKVIIGRKLGMTQFFTEDGGRIPVTVIQAGPCPVAQVKSAAEVQLSSGVAFMSDADLEKALEDAGVPPDAAKAIEDENADARLAALRQSLSILAVIALLALLFSVRIPREQPASASSV